MRKKKKLINKKVYKLSQGKCKICGEKAYILLDVHRLFPKEGYVLGNVVSLCSLCHRKVHGKMIKIDKWYESTSGKILHWFDENGKEHFT